VGINRHVIDFYANINSDLVSAPQVTQLFGMSWNLGKETENLIYIYGNKMLKATKIVGIKPGDL
jgi:hypothetical protein